jgi:hypothetical protein
VDWRARSNQGEGDPTTALLARAWASGPRSRRGVPALTLSAGKVLTSTDSQPKENASWQHERIATLRTMRRNSLLRSGRLNPVRSVGQLRSDEDFVIRSLATHFSGQWWPGEDPPDAYLTVSGEVAAVEISTLTQHVRDSGGDSISRFSEDAPAIWLANELDSELRDVVPDGMLVILTLVSPILKARKTKAQLKDKLAALASRSSEAEVTENVMGNCIEVRIAQDSRPSGKKVVGVVSNQNSSPDILLNARTILEDRIAVKASKCGSLKSGGPLWLALLNDYWLADDRTYRQAFESFSMEHPFKKILLISGNSLVTELHGKE